MAGFSGAIAASAVALAEYIGRFAPVAGDGTPLAHAPAAARAARRVAEGDRRAGRDRGAHAGAPPRARPWPLVQNMLAGAKVSALLVFLALGFGIGHGRRVAASPPAAATTVAGMLLALVPVMFTYSGWNAAAYVAEEVRSPGRNVPLALGLGTLAVIVDLPRAERALSLRAAGRRSSAACRGTLDRHRRRAAVRVHRRQRHRGVHHRQHRREHQRDGARRTARVLRDGARRPVRRACGARPPAIPRAGERASSRRRSGAACSCSPARSSQLVSYTGFAVVLFSGIAVAALFVLRRREPTADRPFRAWGYPWAPAVFVVASAVMVGNEIWRNPSPSLAGVAVIALGIPVYWWMRRR